MTRYFLISFFLLASLFLSADSVSAQNTFFVSEIKQLQEQIKTLQAQIEQLKNELTSARTELAEVKAEKFTKTLKRGMTGNDVKELQEFLKQFPDIYPEGLVTGYFGVLTETAIKKLQEKEGIEPIGIIGPKTRMKLNELVNEGAGKLDIIPVGLLIAPGLQKKQKKTEIPAATTTLPSVEIFTAETTNTATTTDETTAIPPIISSAATTTFSETISASSTTSATTTNTTSVLPSVNTITQTAPIISAAQSLSTTTINATVATTTAATSTGSIATTTAAISTGSITAQVSSLITGGTAITRGTANVAIASFSITNSKSVSENITTIKLVCQGCSAATTADFTAVRVETLDNLGAAVVFNAIITFSQFYDVSFGANGFTIPAGSTKTFTVKADTSASVSSFQYSLNFYIEWRSASLYSGAVINGLPLYIQPSSSLVWIVSTDTAPPVISNIQANNITETSATISWTTNETTSSEVFYDINILSATATPFKFTGDNNTLNHIVNLINLLSAKTYYYIIVSKDTAGNTATSSEQSFTTLTPSPSPPSPVSSWSNNSLGNSGGYQSIAWNGNGYGAVYGWNGKLYFIKLDSNGNKLNETILATAPNYMYWTSIVWDGSKYGIAWNQANPGNLRFATVDTEGSVLSNIPITADNDNNTGERAALLWDGSNYTLSWSGGWPDYPVYFAKIGPDGQSFVVNKKKSIAGIARAANGPIVSIINNNSHFGVVWQDIRDSGDGNKPALYFNVLDSNGNKLIGNDIKISGVGRVGSPKIFADGPNYMVFWTESAPSDVNANSIYIAKLDSAGNKVLTNQNLNTKGDNEIRPSVIKTDSGYGIVWTSYSEQKLYFKFVNSSASITLDNELVSTLSGSNDNVYLTWGDSKYGAIWTNVQNNQLQLYFAAKNSGISLSSYTQLAFIFQTLSDLLARIKSLFR